MVLPNHYLSGVIWGLDFAEYILITIGVPRHDQASFLPKTAQMVLKTEPACIFQMMSETEGELAPANFTFFEKPKAIYTFFEKLKAKYTFFEKLYAKYTFYQN